MKQEIPSGHLPVRRDDGVVSDLVARELVAAVAGCTAEKFASEVVFKRSADPSVSPSPRLVRLS